MQRLVDGLLSLSRIELNQHIRPDGREDLGLLAREAVAALEPVARARGVRIETDGLPGDAAGDKAGDAVGAGISDGASDGVNARAIGPIVRGDRDQLTQALGNLIENALKYGAGQPVRVFLAAPSHDRPGMVGLTVADCGEGIARDHLPRLTERFYRVSVKRSRDQGGTGLGLAIVKHIMARHHGALSIDSAPGLGSAFTLWLPTAPSDGDSAAAGDGESAAAGDGASAAPGVEAPAQVAGAPRASGGAAP
jgi:two-component system phosphate regulon sensor histidine kinase PhoR